MNKNVLLLTCLLFQVSFFSYAQSSASIIGNGSPKSSFALEKIHKSLTKKGFKIIHNSHAELKTKNNNIILATLDNKKLVGTLHDSVVSRVKSLKPEGFRIHRSGNNLFVIGKDEAGMMYGGLELAELIKTRDLNPITDIIQNPYMMKTRH